MIFIAGPIVFGIDLIARHFIVGSQPEDVQQFMAETITYYAWFIVPLPALGSLFGFFLYRWVYNRELKRGPSNYDAQRIEQRADLLALMFSASLPQLPALLGDMSVMMGARYWPALCSTAISMLGILIIGIFARNRSTIPQQAHDPS